MLFRSARTLTVTALPSTRFNARIVGRVECWSRNPTVADTQTRIRARISLDGGTVWSTSVQKLATHDAAGSFVALSAAHHAAGAVTGNIIVEMQAYSTHADTAVDDLFVDVQIVGDH